ncbi:hypothetical protein FA13DRAFT_1818591 [Coprinellus micaceus]|uniref:CFEM domain-containing protein n=1 Tax=Coprinellus micaceus TaxID=71717 RepID=A0A4Y7SN17_COPMI|nr:hypothetical protein FA13DRAFT_1818591 [Coprinellus micaceus]
MRFTNVLAILGAAAFASAQDTSGISACILACSSAAATANNCTSFADIQCVCSSSQFQADATKCLQDNCPSDLETAVNLQLAQCGAASISPTGTAGPPKTLSVTIASTTGTTTAPPTSTGAAQTGTPSNAASLSSAAWGAVALGLAAFGAAL